MLTELMTGNTLPGVLEVFGSTTQGIIAISAEHEVVGAQITESKVEGIRALKELFAVNSGRYAFRENAKLDGMAGLSLVAKDLTEISKGTVKDTADKIEAMPQSEPRVVQVTKVGQGTQQGSQNVSPVARAEIKPQSLLQPNKNVIIPRTTTQISEKAQKGQEALARLKQSMTGQHKAYVPSQPLTRSDADDESRTPSNSSATTGEIDAKGLTGGVPGVIKGGIEAVGIKPLPNQLGKSPSSEFNSARLKQGTTGQNKPLPKPPLESQGTTGQNKALPNSPSLENSPLPNFGAVPSSTTKNSKGYTIETDPVLADLPVSAPPARPQAKPTPPVVEDKNKPKSNTAYVGQNPFKTSSSLKALVANEVSGGQDALTGNAVDQKSTADLPAQTPAPKPESHQTTQVTPPTIGTPIGTVSKLSGVVTGSFSKYDNVPKEHTRTGDTEPDILESGAAKSASRMKSTQSTKAFIQPSQGESVEFNKKGFDYDKGKGKIISPSGFYISPGLIGAIVVCVVVFAGLGVNFKMKADQKDQAVKLVYAAFDKHQYRDVIKQADLTLRKYPDASELRTLKVTAYEKLGENDNALRSCDLALKDHPNDPKILAKHAELCFSLGHRDQAIPDLTKLLNDPAYRTADNFVKRATAYKQTGEQDKALQDVQTAAGMQPDNGEIVGLVATTLMEQNKRDKAYAVISDFLSKHPDDPAMLVARGYCHFVEKNMAKAKDDLQKSIKIKPSFDGYSLLGDINLLDNQFGKAVGFYNKALEVNPSKSSLRFRLFGEYERHKDFASAIKVANKIEKDNETGRVKDFYQRRASCEYQLGQYDPAERDFENAVNENPHDMALRRLSAECHAKNGSYRKAVNDYDAIIAEDAWNCWSYMRRANFYDKDGREKLAQADFEKAIQIAPMCIDAYIQYAESSMSHGDVMTAKTTIDAALKHDPKSAKARELKVKLAHMQNRPMLLARDVAEVQAQIRAQNAPVKDDVLTGKSAQELSTEGYALLKQGESDRAIRFLAQAVRTDPNSATARRYLAHAFLGNSDFANAVEQFEALNKMNPLSLPEKMKLIEALNHVGRSSEAAGMLKTMIADNPSDMEARLSLVRQLQAENKKDEAKALCTQGLQFAKSAAEIQVLKNVLKSIEGDKPVASPQRYAG